jgi:hypothetical protein
MLPVLTVESLDILSMIALTPRMRMRISLLIATSAERQATCSGSALMLQRKKSKEKSLRRRAML